MLYITISTTVHNCVLVLAILAICKLIKTKTKTKAGPIFCLNNKGSSPARASRVSAEMCDSVREGLFQWCYSLSPVVHLLVLGVS